MKGITLVALSLLAAFAHPVRADVLTNDPEPILERKKISPIRPDAVAPTTPDRFGFAIPTVDVHRIAEKLGCAVGLQLPPCADDQE